MKININDKYYVEFDGNQYIPWKYSKGGVPIPVGKYKGKLSEAKWNNTQKYFISLPHALKWVVQDSLQDDHPEIDLVDFINTYETKMEEIHKACKGVKV